MDSCGSSLRLGTTEHAIELEHTIDQSSANLGKTLGLSVVAEDAETHEDWDLLAALGLDVVQGYFVSKPMPAEAVPAWCKTWNDAH